MKNILFLLLLVFNYSFGQKAPEVDLSNPRATVYTHMYFLQTTSYQPEKAAKTIYGFKTSPFVFANLTYIKAIDEVKKNGGIFTALGTGTRIRNENLIFGTIELKCFYLPRTDLQVSPWNFSFITNLKYKYNSTIINKPDFVEIN